MARRFSQVVLLGAHMSIAGGIPLAVDRARKAGCNVLQIFVKNNNQWKARPLSDEEAAEFRARRVGAGLFDAVAHTCYLINLASPGGAVRRKSLDSLADELSLSERLGLSHLVVHPGSHVGAGEARGIERVSRALDETRERTGECAAKIALEVTAGQGTSLGYRFEHLRDIIGGCRRPEGVFVCFDTCHLFASGYDFRSQVDYRRMIEDFDRIVGLSRLRVIHFNDSKRELGSRVDRHQHIGKGEIGPGGFRWFLKDHRMAHVPKILETPKGPTLREDRRNLRVLRSLLKRGN
jgi:deoxyribonuclease-4